jgi:hypothetical protein
MIRPEKYTNDADCFLTIVRYTLKAKHGGGFKIKQNFNPPY